MLISCPKCSAVYMVSENQIPKDGKRFKCAECGNIWSVHPEDFKNMTPETQPRVKSQIIRPADSYDVDDSDLQNMFNRISQDTKGLFSNDAPKTGFFSRCMRKLQVIFSPMMLNCTILLFIFLCIFYIARNNSYEIVGYIPRLENFYKNLGIECIHQGKDIVFKDVVAKNIERNSKHYVEVSGLIYNESSLKSNVLPIKVVMTHEDGTVAEETTKFLTVETMQPKFNSVFRITLPNKTLDAKKLTLSFDPTAVKKEEKKEEKKIIQKEEKKKPVFDFGMTKGMDNF